MCRKIYKPHESIIQSRKGRGGSNTREPWTKNGGQKCLQSESTKSRVHQQVYNNPKTPSPTQKRQQKKA